MDLEQLLAELAKKFGEAADDDAKKAITVAVKSKVKPLWQEAFNEGHGVATAQLQPKLDAAVQAKKDAETAKTAAEGALETLKREQPTTAQLHEEYGQKLQEKDAEIVSIREKFEAEKLETRRGSALTRLRAELAARVHEDYAEVLTQKGDVVKRFQFDDGGNLRVMQGEGNVPFAGDEEAQIKAIAEELTKGTPDIFLRSNVDRGSGRDGASGAAGEGAKGKALYQSIREKATAKEAEGAPDPQEALHKRLGIASAAGL